MNTLYNKRTLIQNRHERTLTPNGGLMRNLERSQKVIDAFIQMTKFDIKKLINA